MLSARSMIESAFTLFIKSEATDGALAALLRAFKSTTELEPSFNACMKSHPNEHSDSIIQKVLSFSVQGSVSAASNLSTSLYMALQHPET